MAKSKHDPQRVQYWAQEILAAAAYWAIVDVETTGFGNDAEIIEVAAVNLDGEVLINALLRPRRPIPADIQVKTGITTAMCAGQPSFAEVIPVIDPLLSLRKLLGYNISFDIRHLRNALHRRYVQLWAPVDSACLMQAYSIYSGQGRVTHERACRQMGIAQPQAHRALGDCLSNLTLLRTLAQGRVPLAV
jgi:DNA polymerase-3 subunit epsilon